ncbi:alpha/beta fold hydrolase [Xylocopilactobacillus apicola]|uniref:Acyltransferase n=1 Tax=Xylocopilactobacillus apicola TaxID=2932184 RepID=A0AAU9D3Z8_9LACO|nr:alpha/beta fold hydrolase [Xylocopilactobacillus apicola]BDR58198.1 acyltransferase [Xylocopilactobacillus apicola]
MKRKNILISLVILLVFLAVLAIGLKPKEDNSSSIDEPRKAIKEPLIMIPGSGGVADSYDSMIKVIQKNHSKTSVLKLTVDQKGKVRASGRLTSTASYPLVVVAFVDSSDQAVPEQGAWFGSALRYLSDHYEFERFNYLGHSNGGPIITYYLEEHVKPNDPKADRLMFLGAPFNGVEASDNKTISSDLKPLLVNKSKIPSNLIVRNFYSDVGDDSDGVVPVKSVKAGKLIYGQTASYEDRKLPGKVAHSWLIEGTSSGKEVNQFFFEKK